MSDQQQQPTQQQIDDQADKEFEAGFSGTRVDAPAVEPAATETAAIVEKPAASTQEPAAAVAAKTDETGASTQQQEVKIEDEPPKIAGLTEAEVRALLAKAGEVDTLKGELSKTRDTIFGKFGELNRTLQALQQTAPVKTGTGKLTKVAFRAIAEKLGEDVAEALAQDFSQITPGDSEPAAASSPAAGQQSEEQFSTFADSLERRIEMRMEKRNLLRQHGDFYEQIEKPDFKLWIGTQPAEMQQKFTETIDSDWLGGQMSAFKDWQKALTKKQERKEVLENAIQPRGTQVVQTGMSDDDAFEAGFYGTAKRK